MSEKPDSVTGVNIYPIKSCHAATVNGVKPVRLPVGKTGFEVNGIADRDFVIVENSNDRHMVTQRGWENPIGAHAVKYKQDRALATVKPNITDHQFHVVHDQTGTIVIPSAGEIGAEPQTIEIFGKTLSCFDQGEEPAEFFSAVVGRAVRLVRADRSRPRYLPSIYHMPFSLNRVAGADGFPFLLVNQASLDSSHESNDYKPGAISLDRFRGNIEIAGTAVGPYGEDFIRRMRVGKMMAYVVKACARCPIPNIDQETGHPSPGLKYIRGRNGEHKGKPEKNEIFFGQNISHIWQENQTIAVGDNVYVDKLAKERNFSLAREAK